MKNRIAGRIAHQRLTLSFFAAACALFLLSGCGGGGNYSPPPVQDTTPPTAPANLAATPASGTQINLAWTASTDNVGVTGYKVESCTGAGCANFAQIATPTATTLNDTGLTASTSYSYRVRANDAAGNNSGYSNTATTSTLAAGNVSVAISPRRGGVTTSQTMPFTAMVTNDVGSAGVKWSTTGGTLAGQTATAATFSSATAGPFTITATSNADNTKSASATIGVTDLSGVTTYHNNLSRDGTNTREFALTTSNVATGSFGKLFSCAVDGEVYAQPLWVANVTIGGAKHNVVIAATQNDSVYAFDADAKPCVQYWKKSFLGTGITPVPPGDTGEPNDINTMIGITGTPVVDAAGTTVYVVAKTKEGSSYHQRLHALSLTNNGADKVTALDLTPAITVPGGSDTGDSSVGCTSTPGNVPFCPLRENQRPGLTLANGLVYVAWASHGDNPPYHGWVMSFNPSTLALQNVYNVSPDATGNSGRESGIWMSGGAPAVDASGNLYVLTGNGTFDANSATAPNDDYGDSFLRLSSSLSVLDWFTPTDEANLEAQDLDLGSGGAVVLVDLPATSPVQHLMVGGGKGSGFAGEVYVLNRDSLGHFNSGSNNVVQEFTLGSGIFSTGAFWQNTLYMGGVGLPLEMFALNPASSQFNTSPGSQSSHSFGFPGTTPAVSSGNNVSGTGIVWALDTNSTTAANASGTAGPAVLFAYDATNLGTLLFSSDTTSGSANAAGNAVKFCVPTVANGKVYLGTKTEITVFGLLP